MEVWLSGKVSEREEGLLRRALEDVLIDGDAIWQDSEQAVHGSYYQKLKFLAGFFGQYGGKIVANLSTAFGATADSQRVNTVERLAAIVEKHENVVIRVEGMIAIKISRNSKPITLIAVLTDDMRSHLARHPMLITQPAQLYDLLVSSQDHDRVA